MIIRPIRPFAFSDQRYWDAAQKVDVPAVFPILEKQGWKHRRIEANEHFQRVDFDEQLQGFDLPLKKDDSFVPKVLQGAFLLSVYDYRPVEEILEEWGVPCEKKDPAAELRRKRQEAGVFEPV